MFLNDGIMVDIIKEMNVDLFNLWKRHYIKIYWELVYNMFDIIY